jgi:hypothetical protein
MRATNGLIFRGRGTRTTTRTKILAGLIVLVLVLVVVLGCSLIVHYYTKGGRLCIRAESAAGSRWPNPQAAIINNNNKYLPRRIIKR